MQKYNRHLNVTFSNMFEHLTAMFSTIKNILPSKLQKLHHAKISVLDFLNCLFIYIICTFYHKNPSRGLIKKTCWLYKFPCSWSICYWRVHLHEYITCHHVIIRYLSMMSYILRDLLIQVFFSPIYFFLLLSENALHVCKYG